MIADSVGLQNIRQKFDSFRLDVKRSLMQSI